jgi:hypothetical protein
MEARDEVEGHVDARRDAGRRDDLARIDEPVVRPHLDLVVGPELRPGGEHLPRTGQSTSSAPSNR